MIALAVDGKLWPVAAGALHNDEPILMDSANLYHHPDSRCVVGVDGRVVPLVSALVYGLPCKCWKNASPR